LLPYEVFLGLNPSQWGFFQELRMDIYILDVEMLQAHTQEEKDMLIQELADILPRLRERGATPEVMAAALLSFFTYRDDFQTEAAWREWVDRFSDPQRPLMQHSSIILQLSLMSLQAIEADSIPFGKGIANRDIVPGRVGGNLLPEEELRIPRRDLIFVDPLQESADVSVLRGIVAGNPDAYPELAAFYGL
jgi:hypothetical protein